MASCECGCGEDAGVYDQTNSRYRQVRGESRRFLPQHNVRRRGPDSPLWRGGTLNAAGYVQLRVDGELQYEHRLVAADMLGRPLEPGEVVHHIDGRPANNDPANLRVFASQADHVSHHRQEVSA